MPNSLIQRIHTQLAMNSLRLSLNDEKYLTEKTLIYETVAELPAKEQIIYEIQDFILHKYCINLLFNEYVIYSKTKHAFWHNLLDWVPTREGASGVSLMDGQKIICDLGLPNLELMAYSHTEKIKPF